jgi:hypothetical protein
VKGLICEGFLSSLLRRHETQLIDKIEIERASASQEGQAMGKFTLDVSLTEWTPTQGSFINRTNLCIQSHCIYNPNSPPWKQRLKVFESEPPTHEKNTGLLHNRTTCVCIMWVGLFGSPSQRMSSGDEMEDAPCPIYVTPTQGGGGLHTLSEPLPRRQ